MKSNLQLLLDKLAKCASENRMVFFFGAGFSKAVMGYAPDKHNHFDVKGAVEILSWVELLKYCRRELGLEVKEDRFVGSVDCPVEASNIITELVGTGMKADEAQKRLKATICKLTDFYPNPEQVCAFQGLFAKINPALIITTNYDGVIETILHRGYCAIAPSEVVERLPDGMTPVYHLHGMRNNPESIVITREDYVNALRPFTYRQQKLASILRENAVVYIGYQKNDINVLSALDCAYNTFVDVAGCRHPQVQLVYTDSDDICVRNKDEQFVVECGDTFSFLEQLADTCEDVAKDVQKQRAGSEATRTKLLNLADSQMNNVLHTKRDELLRLLNKMSAEISGADLNSSFERGNYICLIQKLYAAARFETYREGNFNAYDDCLFIILGLLINMEEIGMYSFFFDFAVKKLEEIACYIGSERGQSWCADKSLKDNWAKIPKAVREAVEGAAQRHGRKGTLCLIKRLKESVSD